MDREVGVDEQVAVELEDAADAVAEVGRGGDARERRGLVVADQRAREAEPGERRADAVARPAREADPHRGPVEALGVARLERGLPGGRDARPATPRARAAAGLGVEARDRAAPPARRPR